MVMSISVKEILMIQRKECRVCRGEGTVQIERFPWVIEAVQCVNCAGSGSVDTPAKDPLTGWERPVEAAWQP